MKINICTWFYAEEKGEESSYSQMNSKGGSSSLAFQEVYWKNIFVLFFTFKRFNSNLSFLLFSNTEIPEKIGSFNFREELLKLGVVYHRVNLSYKTPIGFYNSWRNQFFEFDIFEHITNMQDKSDEDLYLLLDSDCVCVNSIDTLIDHAKDTGYSVYDMPYNSEHKINGLSRSDMQTIFERYLNRKLTAPPSYFGGEYFLFTAKKIETIVNDFKVVWKASLKDHEEGRTKFNEEAHVLSYIYYKNGWTENHSNMFIKRLWTQPFIFRNVVEEDAGLTIWHLPHEKKYGILTLYKLISKNINNYKTMNLDQFKKELSYHLMIPKIPFLVMMFRIIPIQIVRKLYSLLK